MGGEKCDDFGTSGGCSSTCQIVTGWKCIGAGLNSCKPICGDGLKLSVEQCDDGNLVSTDGCYANCTIDP